MEGTLFPPNINQAYVYVSSHGSATIGLELAGRASASYNSNKIAIIPPVFWPGVSLSSFAWGTKVLTAFPSSLIRASVGVVLKSGTEDIH